MECQLTLRNLLRLDAGGLDSGEQASMRAAVEQSPRCQRVLALIAKHGAAIEAEETWASIVQRRADLVDAEIIAGYLEGRLAPTEQKQVEHLALRNPQLLAELVWHFRAEASGLSEILVPFATTERILATGNDLLHKIDRKSQKRPSEAVRAEARKQVSVPAVRPLELQMARPVSVVSRKRAEKPSRRRTALVIAGVSVATLVAGIWLGAGYSPNAKSSSSIAKAESMPEARATESAAISGRDTAVAGVATEAQRIEAQKFEKPEVMPAMLGGNDSSSGWVLVDLNDKDDRSNGEATLDPAASVFHQFQGNISDFEWLMLEGVVALRAPGDEIWFGPRSAMNTAANGLEWRTLPGSWAAARLGRLGELVLDVDSSVKVNTSQKENLISLELSGGRAGLRRLPANVKLKMKLDDVVWDVEVLEDGTNLMFDWMQGSPRLAIGKGYAQVNDRYLRASEQLVWNQPLSGNGKNSRDILEVRPLADSLAWLDKPSAKVLVSGAAQAELLASKNVVGELNRLGASGLGETKAVLAQHLPALLAPEAHLLGVLEGSDATSRNEALNWLLSLSPRSSKTRQVWLSIARKSGVPDLTREYFRLIQILKNNATLTEADAVFLTSGLKHERLFVREMSQVLLELRFGNTVRYDAAEADGKQRSKAAERWTNEILESYQPVAVPKR